MMYMISMRQDSYLKLEYVSGDTLQNSSTQGKVNQLSINDYISFKLFQHYKYNKFIEA